jgi:hypothetical protein
MQLQMNVSSSVASGFLSLGSQGLACLLVLSYGNFYRNGNSIGLCFWWHNDSTPIIESTEHSTGLNVVWKSFNQRL